MFDIIFILFLAIYVFFLPGYLIIKAFLKKGDALFIFALSFGLSIVLLPIISFGATLILHTTMQKWLLVTISTLINIVCLVKISNAALKNK
jgi:uncharacterized membrane protein